MISQKISTLMEGEFITGAEECLISGATTDKINRDRSLSNPSKKSDLAEKEGIDTVVIILTFSEEDALKAYSEKSIGKDYSVKYLWKRLLNPLSIVKNKLFFQASEDQLEFPEDTAASMSAWPDFCKKSEPDRRIWRGIFSPQYSRKVIFTQQVNAQIEKLPRWKPYITIDRRTIDRNE